MTRLVLVAACIVAAGFAPAPLFNTSERDPNKLLALFEKSVQEAVSDAGSCDAIALRKKTLLVQLNRRIVGLRLRDMHAEADAVHDSVVLLESIDGARPLGKTTLAQALEKATADGRYHSLLRAVYVPGDRGSHGDFLAYGYWDGTSYGGASDLPPGYWVYVYPRWFLWAEQTQPR
jgi:hypothetical protein